ncbi:MAG: sulfite oxidase heme-binding subunit YedZ [Gammaproteobacteria bacterium]
MTAPRPSLRLPPPPRALAFALAAAPFLWLLAGIVGVAGADLGPNPVRELTHVTGKTALNLLLITLLVSPLQRITGIPSWLRLRRMMGLFAAFYAALHFLVYAVLELDLSVADLGRELAKRPYIWVGAAALLALVPLAITSTDGMMRRLGRRWQTLHRLVYAIAVLAVWHYWWQVKADIREPLLYASALVLLLGWRVWRRRSRRPLS